MRNALAWIIAAALAAIAISSPEPARAGHRWLTIPQEVGVRRLDGAGWIPHRCGDEPVLNLYHGAYYNAPTAIWLGYAYRPFYRYTAYRVIPRTYVCAEP